MPRFAVLSCLIVALSLAPCARGGGSGADSPPEPWEGPPFSADPKTLWDAAATVEAPPDTHILVLLHERRFVFAADGSHTRTSRMVYRVLTEGGANGWKEMTTTWRPWLEDRPQLRARVVTSSGTVHTLKPETIAEAPAGNEGDDIYRDTRKLQAPLPAMAADVVVEELYETERRRPLFEHGVVFLSDFELNVPVQRSRIVIEAPREVPVRYVVYDLPGLEPERAESDGTVRLTFTAGPIRPREDRPSSLPSDVPRRAHLAFSTGESWQQVASAYAAVVDRQIAGSDLKELLDGLPEPGGAGRDAIDAVWERLRKRVRYTGVEFGEASYVPRSPGETLQRQYGDCKDQSALLIALLRAMGLPAHMALLDTGPGEDVPPALPGLGSFDHAIVHIGAPYDMWIDPTQQYGRAGELPLGDQDRLALLVDATTTSLIRTPASASADNRVVEERVFHLAEEGRARVTVTSHVFGAIESAYRADLARLDDKAFKERLEGYAKNAYLSKAGVEVQRGDAKDLSEPFSLTLEVEEAGRGFTELRQAVAAIRLEDLVGRLPKELRQERDEDTPAREADYLFYEPHQVEWRYSIVAPQGFGLRELPEPVDRALGPARFRSEFEQQSDGSVEGKLVFDSGQRRITGAEYEELRASVAALLKEDAIMVWFDQAGEVLLETGRIREALDEFRRLVGSDEKNVLARCRLARGLLAAGLGEAARREARKAVEIGPESVTAYQTLGWMLQHDQIGRRFEKGFDRDGAIAAYRRALELDPEDSVIQADLAILLEHDEDGVRYGRTANLDQAISEYRKLLERSPSAPIQHNLSVALLRAGDYEGLAKLMADLKPSSDNLLVMDIVSRAISKGSSSALRHAAVAIADATRRRTILGTAATLLMKARRYEDAAEVLSVAARGAPNAAQVLSIAALERRTRRHEELVLSEDDPADLLRRFMEASAYPDAKERLRGLVDWPGVVSDDEDGGLAEELGRILTGGRRELKAADVPIDASIDLALAALQVSVEGDEETGYRVRGKVAIGDRLSAITLFVARKAGRLVVLDGIADAPSNLPGVAIEVLRRVDAGQLDSARALLDWVVEGFQPEGGTDPLRDASFGTVWRKGGSGDVRQMRLASACLLSASKSTARRALRVLEEAPPSGEGVELRLAREKAKGYARFLLEEYEGALSVFERLSAEYPDSALAFGGVEDSLRKLGRDEQAASLARERLERLPNDRMALITLEMTALNRGDFEGVREAARQLDRAGLTDVMLLNNFAWSALAAGQLDEEALSAIQRASDLSTNGEPAVLHTLAAIYATQGNLPGAREVLVKGIEIRGAEEAESADWYVLGLLAEGYGELDSARAAYRRVEEEEDELGPSSSCYTLAQKRLATLGD